MLNGLYSGATALDSLSRQQEAIASNLAHLNTPGHKRMLLSFADGMKDSDNQDNKASRQFADFTTGRMEPTGRKLDLALSEKTFFTYQGANSEIYSQSGVLFLDSETNQLVNGDGLPILGENGPIEIVGDVSKISVVSAWISTPK